MLFVDFVRHLQEQRYHWQVLKHDEVLLDPISGHSVLQAELKVINEHQKLEQKLRVDGLSLAALHVLQDELFNEALLFDRFLQL